MCTNPIRNACAQKLSKRSGWSCSLNSSSAARTSTPLRHVGAKCAGGCPRENPRRGRKGNVSSAAFARRLHGWTVTAGTFSCSSAQIKRIGRQGCSSAKVRALASKELPCMTTVGGHLFFRMLGPWRLKLFRRVQPCVADRHKKFIMITESLTKICTKTLRCRIWAAKSRQY